MNRIIFFTSLIVSLGLVNLGMSTRSQVEDIKRESSQLRAMNLEIKDEINEKRYWVKHEPVFLSIEFDLFLRKARYLEGYYGMNLKIQPEANKDVDDVSDLYVDTEFKGVKGLKVRIQIDDISKGADLETVLDGIHSLEKSTDYMTSEICKVNDTLIVKGEVYGI